MEKYLGKIGSVKLGMGGYQNCQIGLSLTLKSDNVATSTFEGFWDHNAVKHDSHKKWNEDDRDKQMANLMAHISDYLTQAKVDDVAKLKGIPVEFCFEQNRLSSWRILTEVL